MIPGLQTMRPQTLALLIPMWPLASGSRLPVEAHGVPPCDVGELVRKFTHRLRIVGANDGFDTHGDMTTTGSIHRGPDSLRPIEEFEDALDAPLPLKMGGINSQAIWPVLQRMEPSRSAFLHSPC